MKRALKVETAFFVLASIVVTMLTWDGIGEFIKNPSGYINKYSGTEWAFFWIFISPYIFVTARWTALMARYLKCGSRNKSQPKTNIEVQMTEKTAEEIMNGIKLQAGGSTLISFSWAMMMGVIYFPSVAEFTYSLGNTPVPDGLERIVSVGCALIAMVALPLGLYLSRLGQAK